MERANGVLDLSAWKGFVEKNPGPGNIPKDHFCFQELVICSCILSRLHTGGRCWYLHCTEEEMGFREAMYLLLIA